MEEVDPGQKLKSARPPRLTGRPTQSTLADRVRRSHFRSLLLRWYDLHARTLPWRADHDPYRVWVSEIMLQQTRVAAVIEHYRQFLRVFPGVRQLARASEARVLTAWSGLGYYRRARMLHAAAKQIAAEHKGRFPDSAAALRGLPGIGRYTAAAIASIAFGEPVAVVDGNVQRVLSRLSGRMLQGEEVWGMAADLLSHRRPGDFNQALMELGATVCTPQRAQCASCPVRRFCASSRGELPENQRNPPPRTPRKRKTLHYILDHCGDGIVLVQRSATAGLMPGMWELPAGRRSPERTCMRLKHSITTTDYTVLVSRDVVENGPGRRMKPGEVLKLPLTGLARKILRGVQLI